MAFKMDTFHFREKQQHLFPDIQLVISKKYLPIRVLKKNKFRDGLSSLPFTPLQPAITFPIPSDLVPGHRSRGKISLEDRPDGCHSNAALPTARVGLLDVHSAAARTGRNRDKTIDRDVLLVSNELAPFIHHARLIRLSRETPFLRQYLRFFLKIDGIAANHDFESSGPNHALHVAIQK